MAGMSTCFGFTLLATIGLSLTARASTPNKAVPAATANTQKQTAIPKLTPEVIASGESFLGPTVGWKINGEQKVDFDKKRWSVETLSDGSEIYSYHPPEKDSKGEEQKRVIIRDGRNLSSISSYRLIPQTVKQKTAGAMKEESASVVFYKGRLYGVTKCEDAGDKAGRDCMTATRKICSFINQPSTEFPDELSKELRAVEVRALATILTLRGVNHQLENISRHGNRLGLKDPSQTTKGKLTAKNKNDMRRARKEITQLCELTALNPSRAE